MPFHLLSPRCDPSKPFCLKQPQYIFVDYSQKLNFILFIGRAPGNSVLGRVINKVSGHLENRVLKHQPCSFISITLPGRLTMELEHTVFYQQRDIQTSACMDQGHCLGKGTSHSTAKVNSQKKKTKFLKMLSKRYRR